MMGKFRGKSNRGLWRVIRWEELTEEEIKELAIPANELDDG